MTDGEAARPEDAPGGESLVAILEELTELITSARAMPMSASALVNRAEVLDLISSAREVLPGQLAQADRLLSDADAVLTRAQERAQAIVTRAQTDAEALVSQEAIVAAAHARALRLVAEAEAKAEELARDADEYCDRKLAEFEIDLGKISAQVAAGRSRLDERNVEPHSAEPT